MKVEGVRFVSALNNSMLSVGHTFLFVACDSVTGPWKAVCTKNLALHWDAAGVTAQPIKRTFFAQTSCCLLLSFFMQMILTTMIPFYESCICFVLMTLIVCK